MVLRFTQDEINHRTQDFNRNCSMYANFFKFFFKIFENAFCAYFKNLSSK